MHSDLSNGFADEVLVLCGYYKGVFYDQIGFFKMASQVTKILQAEKAGESEYLQELNQSIDDLSICGRKIEKSVYEFTSHSPKF